jgi:PEGA domain
MTSRGVITGLVLLGTLAAAPASAQDRQRRQGDRDRGGARSAEGARREGARAVPRAPDSRRYESARQQADGGRRDDARANEARRQYQAPRAYQDRAPRQYQAPRASQYEARRPAETRRYDDRRYDSRRYDDRRYDAGRYAVPRAPYRRPYYSYSRGGYGSRVYVVPRYIRPRVLTISPYRPYYYRPSIGIGAYYGVDGAYPYGYTPRGYYDPIPGRDYGGVRITDAPREAQVFADGYYVGIVDDFDGIFQHLNLEAGEHRIEVVPPGYEPIAFDVLVQPGRTITLRADLY